MADEDFFDNCYTLLMILWTYNSNLVKGWQIQKYWKNSQISSRMIPKDTDKPKLDELQVIYKFMELIIIRKKKSKSIAFSTILLKDDYGSEWD